eukprot:5414603-Prymnesium_polylepis.2
MLVTLFAALLCARTEDVRGTRIEVGSPPPNTSPAPIAMAEIGPWPVGHSHRLRRGGVATVDKNSAKVRQIPAEFSRTGRGGPRRVARGHRGPRGSAGSGAAESCGSAGVAYALMCACDVVNAVACLGCG